ncbi:IS66 family insertion sequence element accessory protein TnpA [Providencia rustigianii]|uniref:IS66 family insertion sequence element accessory protein TnpA n=1 Tax=Providencia rustigianii TaxID=158850 RepID=UPI00223EC461|nr:IS66 family insertion sequence element accessory protein TnpB [Providencia rustigianii]
MRKRLTNQEWQRLIAQSESSSLPIRTFCKLNGLNPSTFYAKRQRLLGAGQSQTGGFIKAEIVEKTISDPMTDTPVANMTLFISHVKLSIPQETPAAYLAELIVALS